MHEKFERQLYLEYSGNATLKVAKECFQKLLLNLHSSSI